MDIIRRDNITYKEFMEEHYKPGIPLVFTNAAKVWKANGLFSPDWFR
jgi:histone arginine demethylase JMJD6